MTGPTLEATSAGVMGDVFQKPCSICGIKDLCFCNTITVRYPGIHFIIGEEVLRILQRLVGDEQKVDGGHFFCYAVDGSQCLYDLVQSIITMRYPLLESDGIR